MKPSCAVTKFTDALTLHSHVANIGDARSLVIQPAATTHSQLTPEEQAASAVTPGLVRLSVGLESVDDILADLEAGFAAAEGGVDVREASAQTDLHLRQGAGLEGQDDIEREDVGEVVLRVP